MTKQILNLITGDPLPKEGQPFRIVQISGHGFFDPADFDLDFSSGFTGCYRGYYGEYALRDGRLFLLRIYAEMYDERRDALLRGDGPPMYSVRPRRYKVPKRFRIPILFGLLGFHVTRFQIGTQWADDFPALYELDTPLDFTGGIVVGRTVCAPYGVWPRPDCFTEVYEILFERGKIVAVHDRAACLAKGRARLTKPYTWKRLTEMAAGCLERRYYFLPYASELCFPRLEERFRQTYEELPSDP